MPSPVTYVTSIGTITVGEPYGYVSTEERLAQLHAECKRDEAKLRAYLQRKRDRRREELAFRRYGNMLRCR